MTNEEIQNRQLGFMTAIGFLLEHTDDSVRDTILETIRSFSNELPQEIESGDYTRIAADNGANPCPTGYYWDPEMRRCVPI